MRLHAMTCADPASQAIRTPAPGNGTVPRRSGQVSIAPEPMGTPDQRLRKEAALYLGHGTRTIANMILSYEPSQGNSGRRIRRSLDDPRPPIPPAGVLTRESNMIVQAGIKVEWAEAGWGGHRCNHLEAVSLWAREEVRPLTTCELSASLPEGAAPAFGGCTIAWAATV